MASAQHTVDYLVDQLGGAAVVGAKKMFGEYGLYSDGKLFALVCDDQLYFKPSAGGRAYLGTPVEAPPYPGAKPCLLIDGARWEQHDWLRALLRITLAELPLPKPKKK